MSTTINDGGPAFPHHETTSTGEPFHDHLGMTLRDWFAGQALAGMMACPDCSGTEAEFAASAYRNADAMLAARSKGGAA